MQAQKRHGTAIGWLVVLGGISIAGCPANTDLNALLPQAVDLLNQVTAEDIVAGFEDFAARIEAADGNVEVAGLADDVAAAIDALQEAFDSGELDGETFDLAVQDLIGRRDAAFAFVGADFFGGPFGHHFGPRLIRLLGLTDDQIAATRDIFEMLHADIRALRQQARADIRAVLTEAQLAELDGYIGDDVDAEGQGTDDATDESNGDNSEVDGTDDKAADDATARHRRPHHHRPHALIRILRMLDLTDDQIAAIQDIRQQLRMDVRALHEGARADFLALLTQEQLDILEQIRNQHMRNENDGGTDDANDDADDASSNDDATT